MFRLFWVGTNYAQLQAYRFIRIDRTIKKILSYSRHVIYRGKIREVEMSDTEVRLTIVGE